MAKKRERRTIVAARVPKGRKPWSVSIRHGTRRSRLYNPSPASMHRLTRVLGAKPSPKKFTRYVK